MAAIDDLNALLANLPNASLITDPMKTAALNAARVPDALGVWPGQSEYVDTFDVYFAALTLLGFLQAQPVVRQTSSEGTSVAVDAPNWSALASFYRSMSQIAAVNGNDVLQMVIIPDVPHVQKTNMRMGAYGYDNVDTDLD